MIRVFLDSMPAAKKRHRSGIKDGRVVTFDPQKSDKVAVKWQIAALLRRQGHLKPLDGPIELGIKVRYPFPKSWSKKRIKEVSESGGWKTTKPDFDNHEKFYADVLTGIAYHDDCQVARSWSEKKYCDIPGIEITINSLGGSMVNEHALIIKERCSIDDISYLVKKANRMGQMHREIHRIFTSDDGEGSHIFFEVDELKPMKERIE